MSVLGWSFLGKLLVLLSNWHLRTAAESYYLQYVLNVGMNVTSATNEQQCVSFCLNSATCAAVSMCKFDQFLCQYTTCANINMVTSSICKTIVFLNINLTENVNIPAASQEWMMTDACSGSQCFGNTGAQGGPPAVMTDLQTYQPSWSTFFGNAVASKSFSVSSVTVDPSSSFTIFLWFKPTSFNFDMNLFLLTYRDYFTISLQLTSTSLQFYTNFMGCGTSSGLCQVTMSAGLAVNSWHYASVHFDSRSRLLSLYLDGKSPPTTAILAQPQVSAGTVATLTSSSSGLSSDSWFTMYCLKIFSSTLSVSDIMNVARSCSLGKLSFANASTTTIPTSTSTTTGSSSLAPSSWMTTFDVVSTTIVGMNILIFSSSSANVNGSTASKYCQSLGYDMAQLGNSTVLSQYHVSVTYSLTLVGGAFSNTALSYVWLSGAFISISTCTCQGTCAYVAYNKALSAFQCAANTTAFNSFACSTS